MANEVDELRNVCRNVKSAYEHDEEIYNSRQDIVRDEVGLQARSGCDGDCIKYVEEGRVIFLEEKDVNPAGHFKG